MSEHKDIGESGQTSFTPDVYYADDLPEDILSVTSRLQDGDYVFELAHRGNILDNLGVQFNGVINPIKLAKYLRNRIEESREEFRSLIGTAHLKTAQAIQIGNNPVHVYSYRETEPKDFIKVGKSLSAIASKTPRGIYYMPRNVVFLPEIPTKTYNGEMPYELDTMLLFPAAFTTEKYRIPGVTNLEGALTHEWAHQFMGSGSNQLFEEWLKLGRWKLSEWYKFQSGVPEQCVSDYAKSSPHEDFCESAVAGLLNPEYLKRISPGKSEFMVAFLETKQKSVLESPSCRISNLDLTNGPVFPTHFRYTLIRDNSTTAGRILFAKKI